LHAVVSEAVSWQDCVDGSRVNVLRGNGLAVLDRRANDPRSSTRCTNDWETNDWETNDWRTSDGKSPGSKRSPNG
jgi:hypothetical protein